MLEKWLKSVKKKQENIKDNLEDFLVEEKREVKELLTGKQSFKKYRRDASKIFKDYFIPNDNNDNRPKILRPKQLTIIALVLLLMKVGLVGYLFSVYQETAEMSPAIVSDILILTNESRVAAGSQPLELNFVLNQAAQTKAEDMVINNYFSHTSPDGRKPWHFVNRSAYEYLLVGENLAMNFVGASDAHSALMASPSHQKNLLNPKYTHVGLAVVEGKIDGQTTNLMVQMFAYKSSADIVVEPVVQKVVETPKPIIEQVVETVIEPVVEPVIEPSSEVDVIIVASEINPKASEILAPITNLELVVPVTEVEMEQVSEVEAAEIVPTTTINTEVEEVFEVVMVEEDLPSLVEQEAVLADEPVQITTSSEEKISKAAWFLKFSKYFYVGFLLLLIIVLLINIFVRITIQHKSIITHSILLIILILALLIFDFSFMKEIKQAATNIILY